MFLLSRKIYIYFPFDTMGYKSTYYYQWEINWWKHVDRAIRFANRDHKQINAMMYFLFSGMVKYLKREMLTSALTFRALIKNPVKKNFDITFIGN